MKVKNYILPFVFWMFAFIFVADTIFLLTTLMGDVGLVVGIMVGFVEFAFFDNISSSIGQQLT